MSQLLRRGTLRLLGVSIMGAGAGCSSVSLLGRDSEPEPGALVVKNKHSLPHVVSVSVTAAEPVANENMSREALQIRESGLKTQIPVEPDETKTYMDFLSGSEMYTVKMWQVLGKQGFPQTPVMMIM